MPHAASLLSFLVASLLAHGTSGERSSAAMPGPHYERQPETRARLRHGGGENGASRESRELVSLLAPALSRTNRDTRSRVPLCGGAVGTPAP